jgi:hypothetical protein
MKSFVLRELLLLSHRERKARRIRFDPRLTVVEGANDTGKSSILKSIYWTFGAEPSIIHPMWAAANVITAARFALDDVELVMLRQGSFFALFNAREGTHSSFSSVTKELAPHLANLFDFGLTLTSREKQEVIPPPAFLFLPFYVDQDASWVKNWSGFARLGQFPGYRQSVAEFHTGIRGNEYYALKAKVERAKAELEQAHSERRALSSARDRAVKAVADDLVEIDLDSFRGEIDRLLDQLVALQRHQEAYRNEAVDLRNQRLLLATQLHVAEASLREVSKDYAFATEDLIEDHVDCPTCGATYANSFAERFAIAMDEDRCRELITQLREDLLQCDREISAVTQKHDAQARDVGALEALLETNRGTIRLRDVIESQGRQELRRILKDDIDDLTRLVHEREVELKALQKQSRDSKDKERQAQILDLYGRRFRAYLAALDVKTLPDSVTKKIAPEIRETGSDLPRALLGYYFAILDTMRQFSTSTYCPIVIDSPNQQGQDKESLRKMLSFLFKHRPEDSQMIVGLEDDLGVQHTGMRITLVRKHSLLLEDEYASVLAELQPLIDASLVGFE